MTLVEQFAVTALAVVLGACGGGGDDDRAGEPDAGDGGGEGDAGLPETSECGGASPARAVVVAVNGDTDFVQVLVFEDGALGTEGPSFPVNNPRGVAMRSNGREAAVVFGGFGDPVGVAIITLEEGGAGATMGDPVDLGSGQTPFGISYASDDHVVVVTAGADIGTIEAIDRAGDGFVVGDSTEIPDNWPLEAATRPGHDEVIMVRANLGSDDASDIVRLARSGDGWAPSGSAGLIGPPVLDVAIHGGGDRLYGSASDPEDPVGTDNLDAPGVLHLLAIGDGGVTTDTTRPLPGLSSFVSIDPHDRFLVIPTAVYEVDGETETPIIRQYRIVTVPLDAAGAPGEPLDVAAPYDALLTYDLDVAPSGHLIHAMELYGGTVPEDQASPVVVRAQPAAGAWEECQRVHLGGAVELAIAP